MTGGVKLYNHEMGVEHRSLASSPARLKPVGRNGPHALLLGPSQWGLQGGQGSPPPPQGWPRQAPAHGKGPCLRARGAAGGGGPRPEREEGRRDGPGHSAAPQKSSRAGGGAARAVAPQRRQRAPAVPPVRPLTPRPGRLTTQEQRPLVLPAVTTSHTRHRGLVSL